MEYPKCKRDKEFSCLTPDGCDLLGCSLFKAIPTITEMEYEEQLNNHRKEYDQADHILTYGE
jgi:hypothetical protein